MDGSRQVLSGATLSLDEHRHVGGSDPLGDGNQLLHGLAPAHHSLDGEGSRELLLQLAVLPPERAVLPGVLDHDLELLRVEGLLEVVEGTGLHGLHRGLDGREGGHDNHGNIRDLGPEALHSLQPVDARHAQVGDDHVELGPVERRQRLRHRREVVHLEAAPERALHHLSRRVEVVDDHHAQLHPASLAPGIRMAKVAPPPGRLSTDTEPPWPSTACRTMASPSPVPVALVV